VAQAGDCVFRAQLLLRTFYFIKERSKMANMFSGKTKKKIPQSIDECRESGASDPTVCNLHLWAERLERWGRYVFGIMIVLGIISTIEAGISAAYSSADDLILPAVLSSLICWVIYALIEYCAYHAIALLISALASITQYSLITANVALYQAAKESLNAAATSVNTSADSVAKAEKVTTYSDAIPQYVAPVANMWKCNNCGTQNKAEYGQCKKCGQFRSK
jgi:hypothetical protein